MKAIAGLCLLSLAACGQALPGSVAIELPSVLSNDFPGKNRPFGSGEAARLGSATQRVHDRYFADFSDRFEYYATLDAETDLVEVAPMMDRSLGEGWVRDPNVSNSRDAEIISFVFGDIEKPAARIAFVSVSAKDGTSDFKPTQIISSVPIDGLT